MWKSVKSAIAALMFLSLVSVAMYAAVRPAEEAPDRDDPLPAGLPTDVWMDVPYFSRAVESIEGRVMVAVEAERPPSAFRDAYRAHAATFGWAEESLDAGRYSDLLEFKRDGETLYVSATPSRARGRAEVSMIYSSDALQRAYRDAVTTAFADFGEGENAARLRLDDVYEAYRRCRSYSDRGEVATYAFGSDDATEPIASGFFRTAYDSATGILRFEYHDPERSWRRYVMVRDEEGARESHLGLVRNGSLAGVLNSCRTDTTDTVDIVIPLLLSGERGDGREPFFGQGKLGEFARVRETGKERIDGHPCARFIAIDWRGDRYTVWLDDASNLIRRFECVETIGKDGSRKLYTFSPTIDATLDATDLAFQPRGVL